MSFQVGIKDGAYRVCKEHDFECVVKQKQLSRKGGNWTQLYNLDVPRGNNGSRSTACIVTKNDSRGISLDRMARKRLEVPNKQITKRLNEPLSTQIHH